MDNRFLINFFHRHGLSAASIVEETISSFDEKHLGKNEFFLKEGQVANEYMILETGFLRAFTYSVEGTDVTTNLYAPGGIVLEVASFFQRTPAGENIQALADSTGWVITFEKLNGLFHAYPAFREMGRSILVKGFADLKVRMLSLINQTAEQRYLTLLQKNPDIFQQAPLKYIASYLGITDTSLSRIRKELTRK
jgi:CRP-like cAMP-binding protein